MSSRNDRIGPGLPAPTGAVVEPACGAAQLVAAIMAYGLFVVSPPGVRAGEGSGDPILAEQARHEGALGALREEQRERVGKLRASYADALDRLGASATERGRPRSMAVRRLSRSREYGWSPAVPPSRIA